ncbi:MAG: L-carnitine dehydratase/bile acid-inducible protein [Bryobacterales bacterium]|jgi:CoA:oxalate CoA-transferase|nr:L-carnitine dehydratase/bile acid-inducible protein [Bryobacterales bacterium]
MTPLGGLKVLDFSHALAGPYATLLLADYGADVYKLEAPGGSDMGRGWGPPFQSGMASYFLGLNRGKQGLAIDLKQPEGIELCLRLAEKMDILIENFRPGTMDRLGLGYEAVRARNKRLIYCSISGYGQNGPSRNEAAMDLIVQCSSGLVSITGTEAGEQTRCGHSVADITAGMFSVIGILMALEARHKTGEGQYIDVAMQDCMISAMTSNFMNYLGTGKSPVPLGTGFATVAPYTVFYAKDKGFAMAAGSDKLWLELCAAVGHPELTEQPDFATNASRAQNRPVLEALLNGYFAERPAEHWISLLRQAGIPATPVNTLADVVAHPQSAVREMFPAIDHPVVGTHQVIGPPIKLSSTPGRVTSGAPGPGEHSLSALTEILGLSDEAARDLVGRGIVYANDSL